MRPARCRSQSHLLHWMTAQGCLPLSLSWIIWTLFGRCRPVTFTENEFQWRVVHSDTTFHSLSLCLGESVQCWDCRADIYWCVSLNAPSCVCSQQSTTSVLFAAEKPLGAVRRISGLLLWSRCCYALMQFVLKTCYMSSRHLCLLVHLLYIYKSFHTRMPRNNIFHTSQVTLRIPSGTWISLWTHSGL